MIITPSRMSVSCLARRWHGRSVPRKAFADEALARVVIDLSGRPGLEYHVQFPRERVGGMDVDLFLEFFRAFCNHAAVTVHIDVLRGINVHHIAETIFKAFGRALRNAVEADPRAQGIMPSTKGAL
jgi:imidazoleglycerol-phosphate dehydratase